MNIFFNALVNEPFLQIALLGGLMVSIACGVVGSYVVVRRISYIAGGIAHCVLGGIGAAYYLNNVCGWAWLDPIYGAVAAAVAAAIIIGLVSLHARAHEDTIIGGMWAIGMAVGVMFVSATPGYSQDLMSYLFGNILLITAKDIYLICILDVLVLGVGLTFYRQLLAVCFDEQFARARGMKVHWWFLLLLIVTSLTVVLLSTVVGIVMVIALLTLPAAIARMFTRRLWSMMLAATAICAGFIIAGFAASYQPELPTGATIIIIAGSVYLLCVTCKSLAMRGKSS
ncbi:MAG TPA: metal ABC transporter permease [Phycisphaerae bacterium]|nr:metal ABC transporter permease [Phycisphaerae bacterium]HPS52556.1 metal ABC transporter permease [Phycisphaerae bacterium]